MPEKDELQTQINHRLIEELQTRVKRQKAVSELGQFALAGADFPEFLDRAVGLVRDVLDAEFSLFLEMLDGGGTLLLRAGSGWRQGLAGSATVKARPGLPPEARPARPVIEAGGGFFIPSFFDEHGVVSGYSVTIDDKDSSFGAVGVYSSRQRIFCGDEIEFLRSIANILASAIARKKAEQENERAQAQLIQSQKMEIIGKLAGGIAHDFNNIMTVISSFAGLAKKEANSPRRSAYLEQITAASERARNLTRQLLIFSRSQPTRIEEINVNDIITDMLKMLSCVIGEKIKVSVEMDPGLHAIKADKVNVEQLLMNLIINAREAISGSGNIRLRTSNAAADDGRAEGRAGAYGGDFVCIQVEDDGVGIEKDALGRLFEPFYSSKEGKGMGLGLTVVKNIVEEYRGRINVESEPGRGASFTVHLPAVTGKAALKTIEPGEEESVGNGERILLIEDEKWLRKSVALVLSKNGYRVFEASCAQEAENVFEKEAGEFHLVFSDIVLPDDNGIQLVERLASRKSGFRVLLFSGYFDIESQWPVIQERGYGFLQKPYDVPDLLRKIKKVLSYA